MTIQMLSAWNGLDEHTVHTLDSAKESALVADGLARYYTPGMDGSSLTLSDVSQVIVKDPVTGVAGLKPEGATGLNALQALSLAASRRVDLVMLGDSNQSFGGHGFSKYLEKALVSRFGVYASSIYGGAGGTNHHVSTRLTGTGCANDGSAFSISDFTVNGGLVRYGYIGSGNAVNINTSGIALSNSNGFPTSSALKFWWSYGVDDEFSGGSFNPGVRRNDSPYTPIGTVGAISTTAETGFDGMRMASMALSPDAGRTYPIEQRWQIPSASVTGPFISYYTRAEVSSADTGISCHTQIAAGGQSAWNFAWYIQNTSERSLSMFYSEVRRLQISKGMSPIVVFYINTGINDRGEGNTPSLGPSKICGTGDSASEYIDNLRGIQNRIRRIWDVNGWPIGELHWLFVPSHRISDPDDGDLILYRDAIASTLALEPQTSMVDLGSLMTASNATSNGWYDTGGNVHLTELGYDAVSQLIVGQIPE